MIFIKLRRFVCYVSDPVCQNPIYIQDDLSDIKLLCEEGSLSVFTAKQTSESGDSKQTVRVLTDIHNHYALKREKDLLHYLNKFSDDFPSSTKSERKASVT